MYSKENIPLSTDNSSIKMTIPEIVEHSLRRYYKDNFKEILSKNEINEILIAYNSGMRDSIVKRSVILTDYCYNLVNKMHFKRKKKLTPFLLSEHFFLRNEFSNSEKTMDKNPRYIYVGLDYMYTGPVWKRDKTKADSKHKAKDCYYVCGKYKNGIFTSFEESPYSEIGRENDDLKDNKYGTKEFFETEKTEALVEIAQRLGQERFRAKLLNFWNNTCPILGIRQLEILRASHIKPWSQSNDSERMNPYNGLLLSANYDALFDRGLISFDENGRLLISNDINNSDKIKLGLSSTIVLNDKYSKNHEEFMKYHRNNIFKN